MKRAAKDAGILSPRWMRLDGLHHRRAALIAENLAMAEIEERSYRSGAERAKPLTSIAGFFLLTPERAITAFDSLTPYPGGIVPFREEKRGPPSRAYLKLWEILARLEKAGVVLPGPGDTAIDIGSCPGGWTWALAELGATTHSIDGAEIDRAVAQHDRVTFQKGDAFRLPPRKVDWFFSDMICEPKRLPELISRWRDAGCERFAISVKFKGSATEESLAPLRALGGRLRHLRQNKHELTWIFHPARPEI